MRETAGGSRIEATEDAMKKSAKREPVKAVEVGAVVGGGDMSAPPGEIQNPPIPGEIPSVG